MIAASLTLIEHQIRMTPGLKKGLEFLRRPGLTDIPDGRIEIDGEHVFAIMQRYDTSPVDNPRFEYHRAYIDIQCILAGREVIGWTPAGQISITEEYNPDKDIAFGTALSGTWTPVLLQAGETAVFYPEDAHAPKLAAVAPSPVMKIVVKVLV
jgi:YhcH/YjgK/YiaL family protein